jgi:hypothetical protein
VWYLVSTAVNIGETLFQLGRTETLLCRVLRDAKGIYSFEICGLTFEGATLSFYIKPADGKELPDIMQWVKQTFSARFNVRTGRTGHVWGDRYWSEILEGDPPANAEADKEIPTAITYSLSWDSLRLAGMTEKLRFSFKTVPVRLTSPVHGQKG